MDNDEQKPPVSPKSPISLPASMELSQKSPTSLPAPLPVELELLGCEREAASSVLDAREAVERRRCMCVVVVSRCVRERTSLVRGRPRAD